MAPKSAITKMNTEGSNQESPEVSQSSEHYPERVDPKALEGHKHYPKTMQIKSVV